MLGSDTCHSHSWWLYPWWIVNDSLVLSKNGVSQSVCLCRCKSVCGLVCLCMSESMRGSVCLCVWDSLCVSVCLYVWATLSQDTDIKNRVFWATWFFSNVPLCWAVWPGFAVFQRFCVTAVLLLSSLAWYWLPPPRVCLPAEQANWRTWATCSCAPSACQLPTSRSTRTPPVDPTPLTLCRTRITTTGNPRRRPGRGGGSQQAAGPHYSAAGRLHGLQACTVWQFLFSWFLDSKSLHCLLKWAPHERQLTVNPGGRPSCLHVLRLCK